MTPSLTTENVVLILTSPLPAAVIGRQLGVSHQTICNVRNNISYKNVRPDLPRFNNYTTRRLEPGQVAYVRSSAEPVSALAERFGVSKRTIISAQRGETYRDVGIAVPATPEQEHCMNCQHWGAGCDLGFPEAQEDPLFAADCSLYLPKAARK